MGRRSIREAFVGKRVLLTGVTGFLGKALLEKLLFAFPDIGEVRVLVRPGAAPARERVRELLAGSAFDRLRTRGDLEALVSTKLSIFEGDLSHEGLGLCEADRTRLFDELDVILHSAALVAWDERFDRAVATNTLGVRRLAAMAAGSTPTPTLVHVSSIFVNGQRRGLVREAPLHAGRTIAQELGRKAPFSLEEEIAAALERGQAVEEESRGEGWQRELRREARLRGSSRGQQEDEAVEALRARRVRQALSAYGIERARLHGWWDSYTFSKALGEMTLAEHAALPIAVVRPSGITSALREPSTGWLDTYLLVEPLIEGLGRGQIKAFPGRAASIIDMAPVDCVVNAILAAAAAVREPGPVRVFHVGSSVDNPRSLAEIIDIWCAYFRDYPMRDKGGRPVRVRHPRLIESPEQFRGLLDRYLRPLAFTEALLARTPAERFAWGRTVVGRVGHLRRRIERVAHFAELYGTYTLNTWQFDTANTRALLVGLCDADRAEFDFDVRGIDWTSYWREVHIPGMRYHVLHEFPAPPTQAIPS